jgi:hypothetical protein
LAAQVKHVVSLDHGLEYIFELVYSQETELALKMTGSNNFVLLDPGIFPPPERAYDSALQQIINASCD